MERLTVQDRMEQFKAELKTEYEYSYRSIRPIPFLEKQYPVQRLFPEGGVEYLSKDQTKHQHRWQKLDSYKDIFNKNVMEDNRWIIEGEPGSGKSFLTLQLTYEWCNHDVESCLRDVDILIVVKMRQLSGVSSIYDAIKCFILSKDSKYSIDDIREILSEAQTSLVIVLDGIDEYPHHSQSNHFMNIIKKIILPKCKLIVTTRSGKIPHECVNWTNRVRLMGFSTETQERYVREVLTSGNDDETLNVIKEWLPSTSILYEFYQIPLIFVTYAHLSHEAGSELLHCTSITSFFSHVISSLHSHFDNKMECANMDSRFVTIEKHNQELYRLSFQGLQLQSESPQWEKELLTKEIGESFIETFVCIGILREEERISNQTEETLSNSEVIKIIKFYHNLYCDWYAAHYLAAVIAKVDDPDNKSDGDEELEILEDLDPFTFQYLYRFACGLNHACAKHILDYLSHVECGDVFVMLCLLEQRGKVDGIKDNLREICSRTLQMRNQDTRVMQRSVLQLINIAAREKIPVSSLYLFESFQSVDVVTSHIVLKSQLRIPILENVEQLWFEQNGHEMTEIELDGILSFIAKCKKLKTVRFNYSLLPVGFHRRALLTSLTEKNVEVLWYPSEVWYRLNLNSGTWQHKIDNTDLTEEDYIKVVSSFRDINV
ncbi:uncharacterized protein [Apostichopus japonicus]|uniref:uncharacterized protein isoform X2 n=1 Tax=Stichopus japonicus TaxID=307972 RepID=UPI003AB7C843